MEISNIIQQYSAETLGVNITKFLNNAAKNATEQIEEDKLVHQLEATTLNERPKKPIITCQEALQCIGEFMEKHNLQQPEYKFHCIFFDVCGTEVKKRISCYRDNPTIVYALVQFLDDNGLKTPTQDDKKMFEKWFQIHYQFCWHRTFSVNDNFVEL